MSSYISTSLACRILWVLILLRSNVPLTGCRSTVQRRVQGGPLTSSNLEARLSCEKDISFGEITTEGSRIPHGFRLVGRKIQG